MNKAELVALVSEKTELGKKDVKKAVDAILESIEDAMVKRDKLQLVGFGTFYSKPRRARDGRNPQTGENIQIPATMVPIFKPGKSLKDVVANLTS